MNLDMVATESGIRKGKNFFVVREKSGNFTSSQGNLSLGKKSGKREILRVHIYSFPPTFIVM